MDTTEHTEARRTAWWAAYTASVLTHDPRTRPIRRAAMATRAVDAAAAAARAWRDHTAAAAAPLSSAEEVTLDPARHREWEAHCVRGLAAEQALHTLRRAAEALRSLPWLPPDAVDRWVTLLRAVAAMATAAAEAAAAGTPTDATHRAVEDRIGAVMAAAARVQTLPNAV